MWLCKRHLVPKYHLVHDVHCQSIALDETPVRLEDTGSSLIYCYHIFLLACPYDRNREGQSSRNQEYLGFSLSTTGCYTSLVRLTTQPGQLGTTRSCSGLTRGVEFQLLHCPGTDVIVISYKVLSTAASSPGISLIHSRLRWLLSQTESLQ